MNGEGANGECEMEGVGVDESDEGDGGCQRLGCNRRRSFSGPAFPSHPFGPLSLDTHIQSIISFLFNAITHSRSSCPSHLHPRILQHFPSCPVHRGRRSFKVHTILGGDWLSPVRGTVPCHHHPSASSVTSLSTSVPTDYHHSTALWRLSSKHICDPKHTHLSSAQGPLFFRSSLDSKA